MTPALLDTSKLIVGASGSGKTVTAKDEVGQLLTEKRHVAIIDPTGVWWGMRSGTTGATGGYAIPIFGGAHGDIPIRPDMGAAIARILLSERASGIVDLSAIDNSRDWRLFMSDFVAELRRGVAGNFHFVVDEADEFAAERVADDIGFQLRENLIWIAKRGRAQGFVPTWITQRTAEIAKAVISQAQTIVAHQLVAPTDRKAIDDYLKGNGSADARSQVMASLAELQVGERWIYSPRLKLLERGTTPVLTTFDSSRTPAPGETIAEPRTLADLDVSAIAAALKKPDPADHIPEDPREAYGRGSAVGAMLVDREDRIRDLEAANALLTETTAECASQRDGARLRLRNVGTAIDAAISDLQAARRKIDRELHSHDADLQDETTAAPSGRDAQAVEGVSAPAADLGFPPSADTPAEAATAPDREYRALAGLAAIAPAGLTEAAWAARTGYSRKGGAWNRRRKRYLDAGLIAQRDGRWHATKAGIDAAGAEPMDMPPAGLALVKWWSTRLGAPGRALELLAAVHPRALTRDAIAAELRMSAKGGAFNRHISALKAAELVTETRKRLAVAPSLMGEDQ